MRAVALLLLLLPAIAVAAKKEDRRALAEQIAKEQGLDVAVVEPVLARAEYKQAIIDAITRPAEAKPWSAYRPIFLTPNRIRDGRAFLAQHKAALSRVEQETGVPAEVIVAIIGVETNFGRNGGSYRVLDALYTLGVHYPPRQTFFRSELSQLFKLAQEEKLDLLNLKGSYAGAMGWGQFMPSSYRNYARDGDGDGRRDLFNSLPDVFASIANYFVAHGWKAGEPVVVPAVRDADAEDFRPPSLEPKLPLAELGNRGYRPRYALGHDLGATLLSLDGQAGPEYWIGFNNFYVISRYNRSALYSLAVFQLAEEIAEREAIASVP